MMKAVLMSIQPKWCELIANGEKTIEVRKTKPNLETPFKVYIYCTKPSKKYQTICGCMVINTDELYRLPNGKIKHDWSGELMCCNGEYTKDNFLNGKVIGEFICDRITPLFNVATTPWRLLSGETHECAKELVRNSCLTEEEIHAYANGKNCYAWHISQLKIYDKPKELSEFARVCVGVGGTIKCDGCEYYNSESNESIGYFEECTCNYLRPLKRPPQSWCYVEELQNG